MSVPNFYVKKRSKKYHWKWPYWKAAQNVSAKKVSQNVRTKVLAELAFEKLSPKGPYWNAAQNVSAKTVVQNVLTELQAKKASEKATIKNDSSERLPKFLSAKTVVQNVSIEILAEKCPKTLSLKMSALKSCPESYPQKQLFKMFVPKFYVKKRSKNYHWKWPYWNAAQNSTAKTVV